MTMFHAQPYDISASGFYFESAEEYETKSKAARNAYGQVVEEFEIQFIDGDALDAALAEALGLHQGNVHRFIERAEAWSDEEKRAVIIAVGECGCAFDLENDDPSGFDLDIYYLDCLKALAEEFVEEGLFGAIPESLQGYIDYDAIARDLACDYTETCIAGVNLIYRCS